MVRACRSLTLRQARVRDVVMSTQWHPLFAHLLRLLIDEYYEVKTEVPVSELPRRGDLLVLRTLQPRLWEEIRLMASTAKDRPIIDWEAVSKVADIEEFVRFLPPERIIQVLGVERAIQTIGLPRLIETVGLPRLIEASGPDKLLDELLTRIPLEQLQEMIRLRQQQQRDATASQTSSTSPSGPAEPSAGNAPSGQPSPEE